MSTYRTHTVYPHSQETTYDTQEAAEKAAKIRCVGGYEVMVTKDVSCAMPNVDQQTVLVSL